MNETSKANLDEYYILAKRYLNGEQRDEEAHAALAFLIQYHRGLIGQAIKYYAAPEIRVKLEEDLLQECTLALIETLRRYDLSKGTQFSTFAFPYLRNAVQRVIRLCGDFAISSTHSRRLYMLAEKERIRLTLTKGHHPTVDELAQALQVGQRMLTKALSLTAPPMRLDYLTHDEESREIDLPAPTPDDLTSLLDEAELLKVVTLIETALIAMPQDCASVLRLYLGLDGEPIGVYQIAAHLNLDRKTVKTLMDKALAYIRENHSAELEEIRRAYETKSAYLRLSS